MAAVSASVPVDVTVAGAALKVRDLDEGDRAALLDLHRDVFQTEADPAWFNWKYRDGNGRSMGVWQHDRLIAHCGGFPRTLWLDGKALRGLQVGDLMVASHWRGVLTRRGPFFQVCDRFNHHHFGANRPYQLGFGFTTGRSIKLSVMSRVSWDGGVIHALVWDPAQPKFQLDLILRGWELRQEDPASPALTLKVRQAWTAMSQACVKSGQIVGDRGIEYVHWRYLRRPDKHYVFFGLYTRWSAKPAGLCVVEKPEANQPLKWIDWVGPPQHISDACMALRRLSAKKGLPGMNTWASDAVLAELQATGISSLTEGAFLGIPTASCLDGLDPKALHWWFMPGDTDFL